MTESSDGDFSKLKDISIPNIQLSISDKLLHIDPPSSIQKLEQMDETHSKNTSVTTQSVSSRSKTAMTKAKKINLDQYRARRAKSHHEDNMNKSPPDSVLTPEPEKSNLHEKCDEAVTPEEVKPTLNDSENVLKEETFKRLQKQIDEDYNSSTTEKISETKKQAVTKPEKMNEFDDSYDEPEVLTLSSDDENSKDSPSSSDFKKNSKMKCDAELMNGNNSNGHGGGFQGGDSTSSVKEVGSDYLVVECRSLWIGTYYSSGVQMKLSNGCFTFTVPSLRSGGGMCTVILKSRGILSVLTHFEQCSVFFLHIKPSAANYVRNKLKMNSRSGAYFDPNSNDDALKRIVAVVSEILEPSVRSLISTFTLSPDDKGSEIHQFTSIPFDRVVHIMSLVRPQLPQPPEGRQTRYQLLNALKTKTLFIYPPPPTKCGITITTDDYFCLEEEQFLNDVIIDFYFKWLMVNEVSGGDRERTHVFSTFFYKSLTSRAKKKKGIHRLTDKDPTLTLAQKRHAKVASWTKGVDIFEKDFILIPINEESHWFLAVICFPGLEGPVRFSDGTPVPQAHTKHTQNHKPKIASGKTKKQSTNTTNGEDEAMKDCEKKTSAKTTNASASKPEKRNSADAIKQPCIIVFDSMTGRFRARVFTTIRDYLSIEYLRRKNEERTFNKSTMPGFCPKVPLQNNFYDCGPFTLQFAQSFFKDPVKDFSYPMKNLKRWFSQEEVASKRESIARIIRSLMEEQNPGQDIYLPPLKFSFSSRRKEPMVRSPHHSPHETDEQTSEAIQSPTLKSDLQDEINTYESSFSPPVAKKIKINLCDRMLRPKTPTPVQSDDSGMQSDAEVQLKQDESPEKEDSPSHSQLEAKPDFNGFKSPSDANSQHLKNDKTLIGSSDNSMTMNSRSKDSVRKSVGR